VKKGEVICVIPARGGSKGIIGKNLKKVMGLPLVARSILYGKECKQIDKVYVSSDSEEILNVSEHYGALRHKRAALASTDYSSTEDALIDFINFFNEEKPEFLIYLQCTTAFLNPTEVDAAIDTIKKRPDVDTIFSAKADHSFLWNVNKVTKSGTGINHNESKQRQRRQDLDTKQLKEDGGFYVLRVESFLKTKNRFGNLALVKESTIPYFPEIDDIQDLEIVCLLGNYINQRLFKNVGVKVLVSDFYGVMTDDIVSVNIDGFESVNYSRSDVKGVSILKSIGIETIIISSEANKVVASRAKNLNIDCFYGVKNKINCIEEICKARGVSSYEIAFIGNDLDDLELLNWVGSPFIVSNACLELRKKGFYVLSAKGGKGAIREIAELLAGK
tara:strand:- start:1159 stop:2325 length:1167 start_codon:yes stop_codon:yes gene_type:complete